MLKRQNSTLNNTAVDYNQIFDDTVCVYSILYTNGFQLIHGS